LNGDAWGRRWATLACLGVTMNISANGLMSRISFIWARNGLRVEQVEKRREVVKCSAEASRSASWS
jgi:hypothetical protein